MVGWVWGGRVGMGKGMGGRVGMGKGMGGRVGMGKEDRPIWGIYECMIRSGYRYIGSGRQ